jgi:replicative DNA helicase
MADIELEVLSRAIMTGGIDQLIAAGIEGRHFFDPATQAVFLTCAEHYQVWRRPLSLEGVKRHHPDYRVVPSSDDLGYLIDEFRIDRAVKYGIKKAIDINHMLEEAEAGDRDIRKHVVELFMEHAREMAAQVPLPNSSRYSDMGDRIVAIRKQQQAGERPGVSTGIGQADRYVGSIRPSDFFVQTAFSGKGKTQGLVRSAIETYKAGDNVLFSSLEMDADEIWEMFDAEAARLSRRAIRWRELGDSDYGAYEEAAARVRAAQNDIVVIDDGAATVDKLAALVERYGVKTVCVDYVSLMESTIKASSDWERVKSISTSLKALARTMRVRVYAAAQNSKDAALNGPTEDNIAYSSAIFHDCNVMIGWHQTAEWARVGKVQGRLLKNRGGDKGPPGDSGYYEFYEHWDRDRMVFEEWTANHEWMAKAKLGANNGN